MAGRESLTLYRKADIEGYLDKINTGITSKWLSGKSRTWCELYGTMLYLFRDSKRNSTGSQKVDMTQVHMVRKNTADKSGLQFEILCRNKQHTFCASSVDECDNWIRQLQAAMTQKGEETASAQSSAELTGDYETITVLPEDEPATPRIKVGASSSADPGYSEVEIQDPPASSQTAVAASADSCQTVEAMGDDGYTTVEFRRSQVAEHPGATAVKKSQDSSLKTSSSSLAERPVVGEDSYGYSTVELRKKSLTEPSQPRETSSREKAESKGEDSYGNAERPGAAKVKENQDSSLKTSSSPLAHCPVVAEDSYGYSTVEMRKKSLTELSQPRETSSREKTESKGEDSYVYATVQRKTVAGTDARKPQDSASSSADGTPEGSSDEDEKLISTAQMKPEPIPVFPHPLQQEDLEPLAALQEFLSDNRKLCRPSFSDRTMTENPVDDMKKFLEELRL